MASVSFVLSSRTRLLHLGLVLLSLALAVVHYGPLNGGAVALLLTVALQLYLPGYLLARALGKTGVPHPISRFAWVLGCGLGLTVTLGGILRFLQVPVPVYVLLLHLIMFGLVWVLPAGASVGQVWQPKRQHVPLYLVVLLCCVVAVGVSAQSLYRFYGFEDQPIFISLVDWLAHNPDQPPLLSRQIGVINGDERFDVDGWTYNHAAWVWSSGFSASHLIWFGLDLLFVWTIPLITFALAYEVTRREEAATWSVAALTVVGLLTLDNIVYYPDYTAYGRFVLFEVDVLRLAAIALMLPLALLAGLAYLRLFQWRDLMLTLLFGIALAMMHPAVTIVFLISLAATAALRWLAQPGRQQLGKLLPLLVVALVILTIPFMQRQRRWGMSAGDSIVPVDSSEGITGAASPAEETPDAPRKPPSFLVLHDLPLVGTTFIRNPASVFYHPFIALAYLLGLVWGLKWRGSLAAQYIFSVTVVCLLLFFVPGVTEFYNRLVSSVGVFITSFAVPVSLVLGLSLDHVFGYLQRFRPVRLYRLWGMAVALVVVCFLLFVEPFPLPASARDQIRAYNEMQSLRLLHPAHEQLVAGLRDKLSRGEPAVLMVPYDVANVVIEEVSGTFVTGGRPSRNTAHQGDARFFGESEPVAPWLDGADLAFMERFGVTHIVLEADDTRLPQLVLSPQRFQPLGAAAGYFIFGVRQGTEAIEEDDLFQRMNALYGQLDAPRWDGDSFALVRPTDPGPWEPLAARWAARLAQDSEDDIARYGLAFTYLMMGADGEALPLWEQLHARHPDVALFGEALAHTQLHLGLATDAVQTLRLALDGGSAAVRVLAARTLLTESFFYLLDEAQVRRAVEVAEADRVVWSQLAELDRYRKVRERAVLLLAAGQWNTAADWLARLPAPEVSPHDLLIQALAALWQGDVDWALAVLRPATDPDWIASKVFLHPDRWQDNLAAQVYYLLLGEVAYRAGHWAEAEAAYQQAADLGAQWAGRYFLAQTWRAAGQEARADALLSELEEAWRAAYGSPFPELVSLLAVADHQALYVLDAVVGQDEDDWSLTLWAIFGAHGQPYPVQSWRVRVTSRDATEHYAEVEVPALSVNGALVRAPISVSLPGGLPPLTQARVFVEPRHSDLVVFGQRAVDVVLNRPDAARMEPDAIPAAWQVGPDITLRGYAIDQAADALSVTLYWQAASRPPQDYQVLVHVLDESGRIVLQGDSGPVEGRYPTSQWRVDTLIADRHEMPLRDPLPEGRYEIRVGLYRLADGSRLPVTPVDERVIDNSVVLETFSR